MTAGFTSPARSTSLYPAGIPIGQVSNANQNDLINNGQVQVSPAADLRHLDVVQILTPPQAGNAPGPGAASAMNETVRLSLRCRAARPARRS